MPSLPESAATHSASATAPTAVASSAEELRIEAVDWLRLQELYHLLDAAPPERRRTLLEEATADPALRERVLSLLATSSETGAPPSLADPLTSPGARVGPYAILRALGSGGLGSVYLIERLIGGAVQQCALKLLSMRPADPSFRARFEREQQILATLQHPNITHLLDAGISETGQPYLVMEFVDGVDLTQYCDVRRLPLRERLTIFLEICDAVTYAHSKLVVHLDLKPSNVLVTAEGQVKLLDFGTSKLIEADASYSEATTKTWPKTTPTPPPVTTMILATPAYASPEQMRGEPVTTSCDLYSLGTILYELLAGHRPFETASAVVAMQRAASEQEPARLTAAVTAERAELRSMGPERMRRMLRGDLASIVARCLRSRPQDRYSSVEALAQDLRRYLAGHTVQARRQTARYRLLKFARRNRTPLAAAALVLLLLLGAGGFAYQRQQQALEQGRRAQQMQAFLSQLIHLANEQQTGKPAATVTEFLDLGVQVLPSLIQNPGDRRAAQLSLGESMYDSRDFVHALPVLEDVARSAGEAKDTQTEVEAGAFAGLAAYAMGNVPLSDTLTDHGLSLAHARGVGPVARVWIEGAWALSHAPRNVDLLRSLALLKEAELESRRPGVPDRERLWVLQKYAAFEQATGAYARASQLADAAYDIVRNQPYALCDRSSILLFQANLVSIEGNEAGSLPIYRQSIEAATACSGADSTATLSIESLLARALINNGSSDQAIALLQAALPLWRKSTDVLRTSLALTFLARAYQMHGDYDRAEEAARQALDLQQGKVNPLSSRVAMCHLLIAQSLNSRGRFAAALSEARLTNQIYDRVEGMTTIEELYHAQAQELLRTLERTPKTAAAPLPGARRK